MGIQTMGLQGGGQQSHLQALTKQISWYNLTLDEVGNRLVGLGKPLGSMNLDELLQNLWLAEANRTTVMDVDNDSRAAVFAQRQASLSLARALSEKTVDEVWNDIQLGQKKKCGEGMKGQERELTFGEMTLEDFLIKAAVFSECLDIRTAVKPDCAMPPQSANTPQNVMSLQCAMPLQSAMTLCCLPQQMEVAHSPVTGRDTHMDEVKSGHKRDAPDALEKTDRRLRRKIKNRESAARSRARKQAYHNELVSKVSRLEEDNLRLKRESELEMKLPCKSSAEPTYQLRRTSSASF